MVTSLQTGKPETDEVGRPYTLGVYPSVSRDKKTRLQNEIQRNRYRSAGILYSLDTRAKVMRHENVHSRIDGQAYRPGAVWLPDCQE